MNGQANQQHIADLCSQLKERDLLLDHARAESSSLQKIVLTNEQQLREMAQTTSVKVDNAVHAALQNERVTL